MSTVLLLIMNGSSKEAEDAEDGCRALVKGITAFEEEEEANKFSTE